MTETTQESLNNQNLPNKSELQELKETATRMGITFPNNANLEKMKTLIQEHVDKVEAERSNNNTSLTSTSTSSVKSHAAALRDKAFKLVRIRLSVLNPAKQKWSGEFFTTGNDIIGYVERFIPFEAVDGIWHVEQIMVDHLKSRKYQSFPQVESKYDRRRGTDDYYSARLLPEFAVEILPPLTQQELDELRQRQDAQGSIE